MLRKIKQIINYIKRFYYYGKIGASRTYDFDSAGIHVLINAHMERVSKFMHNPDLTNSLWNSDPNNRRMRQLREFVELSRRVIGNEAGYFHTQVYEKWDRDKDGLISFMINNEEYRKEALRAIKKDNRIRRQHEERYYYMLKNVVPNFSD